MTMRPDQFISISVVIKLLLLSILFSSCRKGEINLPDERQPPPARIGTDTLHTGEFAVKLFTDSLKKGESGQWSVLSGPADDRVRVRFDNDKSPRTVFRGLPGETYELIWKVTIGGSTLNQSVTTVTIKPLTTSIQNNTPPICH